MLIFESLLGPLQAPDENIAKYKGFYDEGPEVLREKRLKKMNELGLVDPTKKPAPLVTTFGTKRWSELSEQERKESAKKMEVYAAMIEGEEHCLREERNNSLIVSEQSWIVKLEGCLIT